MWHTIGVFFFFSCEFPEANIKVTSRLNNLYMMRSLFISSRQNFYRFLLLPLHMLLFFPSKLQNWALVVNVVAPIANHTVNWINAFGCLWTEHLGAWRTAERHCARRNGAGSQAAVLGAPPRRRRRRMPRRRSELLFRSGALFVATLAGGWPCRRRLQPSG